MTTKHTPRPWILNDDENTIRREDGVIIAAVYDLREDYDGEQEEANASLIAAAPDLLAALEEVSNARARQSHEFDIDAWYAKVRAAIAKAKGE